MEMGRIVKDFIEDNYSEFVDFCKDYGYDPDKDDDLITTELKDEVFRLISP